MARIDISNLKVAGVIKGTNDFVIDQEGNTRRISFSTLFGGHLPLKGGTLTGELVGTSASFSGDVLANNIPKYFVSGENPNPSEGVDGDIWIKV